jgi:hypothetical protein
MLAPYRNSFRVRVLHGRSQVPAGVGVVVGQLRIITRTHVVNIALGQRQRQQGASEDNACVEIDFPILDGTGAAPPRACTVAKWSPPPADGVSGGDVPSLVLVGQRFPAGKAAARIVGHAAARGALVHEFGYAGAPPRLENGAWTWHLFGLTQGVNSDAASRHWP